MNSIVERPSPRPEARASHESGAGALSSEYNKVRGHTEFLAASLSPEDQCVQSMPDASPAKWHRAHTTWFFEEFVLAPNLPGYRPRRPEFRFLFNSYYEAVGARQPRALRGHITRPSADEVSAYRAEVDAAMLGLLAERADVAALVTLGLQHEQQHQELLVTDILHAFAQSPLLPAAIPDWRDPPPTLGDAHFIELEGGIFDIGHGGKEFGFDSETPRHAALLRPFRIADRLVKNREWLAFMDDGGYKKPEFWMSDGWATARADDWTTPLYWRETPDGWFQMEPGGLKKLEPEAPVRHVSWYEADAYARWAGARLPTEFEFEHAATAAALHEVDDRVWQWTASAYLPYPGFAPAPGAIGEYNGKFMINQMVLRGGSVATPPGHARPEYRNFFNPDKRWQFSGLRLAKEV